MTYSDAIIKRITSLCIEKEITINKLATLSGITQSIIKNFSSDLGENMLIIEDVCINAKGYKDILEHKYKVVV